MSRERQRSEESLWYGRPPHKSTTLLSLQGGKTQGCDNTLWYHIVRQCRPSRSLLPAHAVLTKSPALDSLSLLSSLRNNFGGNERSTTTFLEYSIQPGLFQAPSWWQRWAWKSNFKDCWTRGFHNGLQAKVRIIKGFPSLTEWTIVQHWGGCGRERVLMPFWPLTSFIVVHHCCCLSNVFVVAQYRTTHTVCHLSLPHFFPLQGARVDLPHACGRETEESPKLIRTQYNNLCDICTWKACG